MKEIILPNGRLCQVDDEDYSRVNQHKWYLSTKSGGKAFAVQAKIEGKFVYLSRFIIIPPKEMVVDHLDKNPLNNQKANLRIRSRKQAQKNRYHAPKTSKYRGVSLTSDGKKYQATIRINGKSTYLGCFDTEREAALRYNSAVRQHHGNEAFLNPVE